MGKREPEWVWNALGVLLPIAAAVAARKALLHGYRFALSEDPPLNPASREVAWKDAILWTALTGVAGAMAKLAVRRALADTDVPVAQGEADPDDSPDSDWDIA